jgi:tRNA threonylcarbamoyladenosine biosynthesis protein TsaE
MNAAIALSNILKINMQLKRRIVSTAFVASVQHELLIYRHHHHYGKAGYCHQLLTHPERIISTHRGAARMMSHQSVNNEENQIKENGYTIEICVPTPDDMEDLGGILSVGSKGGDVILLDGDLGAGKTCFSRGFVRGRTGIYDERVTSPTYLLSNSYDADDADGGTLKIYHMDLYRLSGSENDLLPLNLDNVFATAISLIEWPSRLSKKPDERLEITLTIDSSIDNAATSEEEDGDDFKYRRMKLVPFGKKWTERLQFLQSEGLLEDLM